MIRTLIIDDEALARQRIKRLLIPNKEVELVGECSNGMDAIQQIMSKQPDLIFLDIQMKDINGFQVLENLTLEQLPLIIFVTAYDKYAIKAFDYFAFDYLLKPFKEARFILSLNKAIQAINEKVESPKKDQIEALLKFLKRTEAPPSTNSINHSFPIKTNGKICFIEIDTIQYIEASGYYIEIFTTDKKYLHRESLSRILSKLDSNQFIRIHRSTIINSKFLLEINHIGSGDIEVQMKNGKHFRVSKSHKESLFNKLGLNT